jgi:two-component system LytT family response regulator
VRAFEVHALDYLLKPFDRERFDASLERARQALRDPSAPEWERRVTEMLEDSRTGVSRFLVRQDGRVILVPICEVDWIEAQGNYVLLHPGAHTHLLRESMIHVEGRLDARQFRRVNRSAIVNLAAIAELRPGFHGDYEVAPRNGERLKLTAGYRCNLEKDALGGL